MDNYQNRIRTGEPVMILSDITVHIGDENINMKAPTIGIFIRSNTASVDRFTLPHTTSFIRITPFIFKDGGVEVDSKLSDIKLPEMLINDWNWFRIDSQSKLYQIITYLERGDMFNMHQEVRVIDGQYKGSTGFINGIHVDRSHNLYTVRFEQKNEMDPVVEHEIPGWCLIEECRKAETTTVNRSQPGTSDELSQLILSSKMNPVINDFLKKVFAALGHDHIQAIVKDVDLELTIRKIVKHEFERVIAEQIQDEFARPLWEKLRSEDVTLSTLMNHATFTINIKEFMSELLDSTKQEQVDVTPERLEHFDEDEDDD